MRSNERRDLRFLLTFLTLFFVLQYGYFLARDTVIERIAIDALTVRPSAAAINLISPQEQAAARGNAIVSPYLQLSVRNGCEGIESILLLVAAIAAFRARWQWRLLGITVGVGFVYLLNQVRIVALYYAFQYDRSLFAAIHGYIGPAIIVLLASAFFLLWMRRDARAHVSAPIG